MNKLWTVFLTKHFKHSSMLLNRRKEGAIRVIWKVIFLRRFLYDFGDCPVMNVTNCRKKVMLHLKVQSAYKPGEPTRFYPKIRGGKKLMNFGIRL